MGIFFPFGIFFPDAQLVSAFLGTYTDFDTGLGTYKKSFDGFEIYKKSFDGFTHAESHTPKLIRQKKARRN